MKKKFYLAVIIFLCILCSNVHGLTSDLKEIYKQSETAIVKLGGSVLTPISAGQVKIERQGHIETPVEKGSGTIAESNYVWFITPGIADSYSLIIENIETTVNGAPTIVNYEKTFLVGNDSADYNVKPGVIYSTSDFYLEFNSKKDENQEISVSFPETKTFVLKPGYNKVKFSIANVVGTQITNMAAGIYSLPAYVKGNASAPVNQTTDINASGDINQSSGWWAWRGPDEPINNYSVENISKARLIFDPVILQMIRWKGEDKIDGKFSVTNTGEEATSFVFAYNMSRFKIDEEEPISLLANESKQFTFEYVGDRNRSFGSYIYARWENYSARLLVQMAFVNDVNQSSTTPIRQNSSGGRQLYPCAELAGKICASEEVCSGSEQNSQEGICCIGECGKASNSGEGGYAWLGYLLGGICVLVLIFIFLKYRKVPKKETNPLGKTIGKISMKDSNMP